MEETFWHGLSKSAVFEGTFRTEFVCLARDRDLAMFYADDDEERLLAVTVRAANPLVLDTPEAFRDAWLESGAQDATGGFWHEGGPHRTFLRWAAARGHDVVDVPESAFEGDVGYEWAVGTVGDPQVAVLDKAAIVRVEKAPAPRGPGRR